MILWQVDEKGVRHPARYGSFPMPATAAGYSQIQYEIYGLYRALQHWKLYLVGCNNLTVEMDASAVEGMLKKPDQQPRATLNRWISVILMTDFKFRHVDATKFRAPDALSRRPKADDDYIEQESDGAEWLERIALYMRILEGSEAEYTAENKAELSYSSQDLPSCYLSKVQIDQELKDISYFLNTLEMPRISLQRKKRFLLKAKQFFWRNEHLYRQSSNGNYPQRVLMDPTSRLRSLIQIHEKLGHRGVEATYRTLQKRVFWPRMLDDVRHHVRSCHDCQLRSVSKFNQPVTVSLPS
jgi:hypothetical protein